MSRITPSTITSDNVVIRLWRQITAVPYYDAPGSISLQRQATVLQQLAVACLFLGATGIVGSIPFKSESLLYYIFIIFPIVFVSLIIVFNRAGRYQTAATLLLLTIWLFPMLVSYIVSIDFPNLWQVYLSSTVSILVMSMLFPRQRMIWLAGSLNVLSTLIVYQHIASISWEAVFGPLFMVLAVTLCASVIHDHHHKLETQRQVEFVASNNILMQQVGQHRRLIKGLSAILDSTDELLASVNPDQLWRRGSELAREIVGVDRSSIFEYNAETNELVGTYGTDMNGATIPEHAKRLKLVDKPWIRDAMTQKGEKPWTIQYDTDIYASADGVNPDKAHGWTTFTQISSHAGLPSAMMFCDSARSGRAFDPLSQDLVSVYCTLLGGIVERKRAELRLEEKQLALETSNQLLKQQMDERERLAAGLANIINASDELLAIPNRNQLWKRGVELARESLGLDRTAIFEYDPATAEMIGTYGTDINGATVAEHSLRFKLSIEPWLEDILVKKNGKSWDLKKISDLLEYRAGMNVVVARGWNAYTLISTRAGTPAAIMFHDNAISERPFDPLNQEFVVVYCSLLGAIAERKRAEMQLEIEHKKAERQLAENLQELRLAQRMAEEGSRIKAEFLSTVSHELRTPLNAIIGFSDVILMGMSGDINPKQRHQISRLRENGIRLLTLINNVLDLIRLEARRVDIINKPFSPQHLTTRIAGQMEALVQQKKLPFNIQIDAEVPEMLLGDERHIEQVIVNLLSNAFKFTDTGAINLMLDTQAESNTWRIRVVDTGIGIAADAQDLIFENFRQVEGGLTRAYKGTGLGLSVTHNLIRLMNGKITVASEPGVGSTFGVTLPLLELPISKVLPQIPASVYA